MSWTIKLSSRAVKQYEKLDKPTRKRIKSALKELENLKNPLEHRQVKPLVGKLKGFYRLRVGNYRVIFSVLKEEKTIAVVYISPRGDAYK